MISYVVILDCEIGYKTKCLPEHIQNLQNIKEITVRTNKKNVFFGTHLK